MLLTRSDKPLKDTNIASITLGQTLFTELVCIQMKPAPMKERRKIFGNRMCERQIEEKEKESWCLIY